MAEDDALEYGLRDAHELRYELVEVGAAMALAYLLHSQRAQQHRCGSCSRCSSSSSSSSVKDGCYVMFHKGLVCCTSVHAFIVSECVYERVSARE